MKLQRAIEEMVSELGYEFVACEVVARPKGQLLRVLADKNGGIGIADLRQLSDQLNGELIVEFPEMENYLLEVSSPGLDRPLTKAEDYQRFLGQEVKLTLVQAVDARRRYQGHIESADDQTMVLAVSHDAPAEPTVRLELSNIEKANLVPKIDFDALRQAKKDRKAKKKARRKDNKA